MDRLKTALDDVDASLFIAEQTLCNVQKQYSDPLQAGGKNVQIYEVSGYGFYCRFFLILRKFTQ